MWYTRLYLGLILVTGGQACAQKPAGDWFPIHIGDKRTYEYTTRDENGRGRTHLDMHTWRTEETTTGSWTVPEGTLVGRQVRVIEGSPRGGWRVNPSPVDLIRGDCVYGNLGDADWDPSTHELTANFRKGLSALLLESNAP